MISCGARLAPFDIPQLREIMSYDELELDKLGDEKSALFFLISDTDTTEGRSRGQSESYSQNMQRLGRELMTTSEITTMPGDKCILQLRGLPPFLSPKYDLKKHPNYKYTAEFDKKKNAFRLESLFRHRPLRLKPEDEYTVYEVDGSDTDEEADLLNFDDLDSDEFV